MIANADEGKTGPNPAAISGGDQVIDCDCSNYWICSHRGPLRIELAIQRLGWEFDFYERRAELASRVYCSLCGKYHPTFRLGWKTRPGSYTGGHGAGAVMKGVIAPPQPMPDWRAYRLVGGRG